MTATLPLGELGLGLRRAAVVGDAVADPFTDTAGPFTNLVIKLRAVVRLVVAPWCIR